MGKAVKTVKQVGQWALSFKVKNPCCGPGLRTLWKCFSCVLQSCTHPSHWLASHSRYTFVNVIQSLFLHFKPIFLWFHMQLQWLCIGLWALQKSTWRTVNPILYLCTQPCKCKCMSKDLGDCLCTALLKVINWQLLEDTFSFLKI